MIAILDTGGANHASIQNALRRLDCESRVTLNPGEIAAASHLILPGVGHAGFAMERIQQAGVADLVRKQTQPVLGICLGMQIMFGHCDEGDVAGLGLFAGRVRKLTAHGSFRVPHMGWNQIQSVKGRASQLLKDIPTSSYFYFVHSYGAPMIENITHATGASGDAPEIPAVLEFKNFFATQFHPERSGPVGSQLLRNFIQLKTVVQA